MIKDFLLNTFLCLNFAGSIGSSGTVCSLMILCSRDSVCKSLRSLLYLRYCALFPPCKAFELFVFNRSEIALDVFAFVVVLLFFSGRKTF
jgi:hypothetical protein